MLPGLFCFFFYLKHVFNNSCFLLHERLATTTFWPTNGSEPQHNSLWTHARKLMAETVGIGFASATPYRNTWKAKFHCEVG